MTVDVYALVRDWLNLNVVKDKGFGHPPATRGALVAELRAYLLAAGIKEEELGEKGINLEQAVVVKDRQVNYN